MTVSTRRSTTAAGVVLILATGLIHLLESGEYLEEAPYVGYLFIANAVGAAVVAIGLLTRLRRQAWIAAILVAGGTFVAFVLSRTVGLPSLADDVGQWEGIGLVSRSPPAWATAAHAEVDSDAPPRDREAWRPGADPVSVSTSTTRPRWGGTEGNEVLTIGAAVVLTVQLVVDGITIIWMGGLVIVHPFVGMALIPPLALKLGSTGYRFARYLLLGVRGARFRFAQCSILSPRCASGSAPGLRPAYLRARLIARGPVSTRGNACAARR